MATRLRRSKRNIPPPSAFTKEQKFEKLISYVTNNDNKEALREFHMPTYVSSICIDNQGIRRTHTFQILEGIINNPRSKTSSLEDLPLEVGMKIQDELTGNDLIMLALTSKTMAARVEACPTRKIANISYYLPRSKDASKNLTHTSADDEWRALGFLGRPTLRYGWLSYDAAREQHEDLRRRMHAHLGPKKYAFCFACSKFRVKQKQFWNQLIEHENNGNTKTKANSTTKKQIAKILDQWAKAGEDPAKCPVHDLLRESIRFLKA